MNRRWPNEAGAAAAPASGAPGADEGALWPEDEIRLESVEAALASEGYAEILYQASYKSARFWCEREARTGPLSGIALLEHYLSRLSRHGWGRFRVIEADAATGCADIQLDCSPFVLAQGEVCSAKTCCRFAGWFAGIMDWICESRGRTIRTVCHETQCGADGYDRCIFAVRPRASN
ncbi:MAG: hydrocarbon binding protein [Rhodocyclaceae bacterium]|nr:hydrocarbon binding protein [Rhodocyclaceae bacterium]